MGNVDNKTSRLLFLDVAKLIGIILMVYCHARINGVEIIYIYAFHMPLFMVINGMTFKYREDEGAGAFLIRKIKGYIVPFLILGLLLIITDMSMDAAKGTVISWKYFTNKLVYLYQNPRPYPLWFVLTLFFSDIWLYIFIRISFKKDYLILLYAIISLTLILLFYKYMSQKLAHSFDASFVGVFFVTIGYLFYRHWNKKPREFILNNRLISLGIGAVLLGASILLTYYQRGIDNNLKIMLDVWGNYYKPFYIRIPAALFGSFGVIFISNSISNKVMGYLGRHTLVVLAFQQNLTIRLFKEYIAKDWRASLQPFDAYNINTMYYAMVCTLFTLAVLIPLSIIFFETHVSYIFMKRPAKWYLSLIDKIKMKLVKN